MGEEIKTSNPMRKEIHPIIIVGILIAVVILAGLGILQYAKEDQRGEKYSKPEIKIDQVNQNEANDEDFCGVSHYDPCKSDADCGLSGCSSEICVNKQMSLNEVSGYLTDCQWKDCYDAQKYQMSCGCVDSQCQWKK